MRRLAVVLVLVMVASMLLPCTVVKAEPAFVPHEDPAAAQSVLDAYSFLSQYVEILALISAKQYGNASALTEQLSHISVPEDVSYIINRYNNLTQELIQVLSDLEISLDKASYLLDQYRLNEADQVLDQAGFLVAKTQILLEDLQDATSTLSQRLGVFAATAENKLRQTYNQLESLLQRLKDLIDEYHALLQRLNQQAENIKIEELQATSVSLNLNATSCFVGGFLAATGKLTTDGQGLQNRTVTLLLDDSQVTKVTTNSDGSYYAIIQVPYKYIHSITVQAVYTPTEGDKGTYLGSSGSVVVEVLFYETVLSVSVPVISYPGLPLSVNGKVTTQQNAPLSGREVSVRFDNNFVARVQTDSAGIYKVQFTVSDNAKTGPHQVAVSVSSAGVYAGTSQQRTVNVTKLTSKVDVHAPSFVLLPAEIHIEGMVSSATIPLENAEVTVTFADISVTVTSMQDGTFNATLSIPLNAMFVGSQDLDITVEPHEPWQANTQTKTSIFIVNSANVGFASIAFISVGAVFYLRFARPKRKKAEDKLEAFPEKEVQPPEKENTTPIPAKPEYKFEGEKGKVVEAYAKALRIVESITGCVLQPQMTLREFLQETKTKLLEAPDEFTKLTALTERTLYSAYPTETQDVTKAETLAATIVEALEK
ncbi:MAG: hypothetical protein NWF05_06620 [Candidatus Bathyarchaeota archaeon]|nr:hypothetical protein [Candidatus Bathyarchaeota archaeon]